MKILSVHIDNFGRLHDLDHTFRDGLNSCLEENGYGKSTFAAFLVTVFYGLKDSAKDSLLNERKRYAPWQGGAFGGSVRFMADETVYRLERYFGTRKAEDRFALYDGTTGLESRRFTENIGEELFGLDRASFEKTVFMGQQSLETSMTSGISARMGSLEDELADMRSYDAAMQRLDRMKKDLTPNRKTGSIARLKARRSELRADLRGKEQKENELDALRKELERQQRTEAELQQEIDQWNGLGTMLSRYLGLKAQAENWERLKKNEADQRERYQEARGAFPGVIPQEEALSAVTRVADRLDADRATVRERSFTEEETLRLDSGHALYTEQGFSEEEEETFAGLAAQEAELEQQILREAPSAEEKARYDALCRRYPDGIPSERKLRQAERLWHKAQDLESAEAADRQAQERWMADSEAAAQAVARSKQKALCWLTAGAIAGILITLYWIFLGWKIYPVSEEVYAGLGAFGLLQSHVMKWEWIAFGAGFLIGTVLLWVFRGKAAKSLRAAKEQLADPEKRRHPGLDIRIARENAQARRLQNVLSSFGKRCGMEMTLESFPEELALLRRDGMLKEELRLRLGRYEAKGLEGSLAAKRQELKAMEERFGLGRAEDETYTDTARRLRAQRQEYRALRKKKEEYRDALRELENDEKRVREYLAYLNIPPGEDPGAQLRAAGDDLLRLAHTQEALDRIRGEREEFEAEHDISRLETLGPAPTAVSPEEIRETVRQREDQRKAAQEQRYAVLRRIEDCSERLQEIQLTEEEENRVAEQIAQQEERYRLLEQTETYLTRARQLFMARYMEPFQEAFDTYLRMFAAGEGRRFRLDVDLNMQLEENGTHPLGSLSSGLSDMVALCRRLAMVDAMYPGEKPFLILDDPFVNLDDTHLKGGLGFLRQVSERYQIFYLTCHSSRMQEETP